MQLKEHPRVAENGRHAREVAMVHRLWEDEHDADDRDGRVAGDGDDERVDEGVLADWEERAVGLRSKNRGS